MALQKSNARHRAHRRAVGIVLIVGCFLFPLAAPAQPQGQDVPAAEATTTAPARSVANGAAGAPQSPAATGAAGFAPDDSARSTRLPRDLSPWGMYLHADWVVKAVLIGLGIASIINLTILLAKSFELLLVRRRQRFVLDVVANARTLAEANEQLANANDHRCAGTELIAAAANELSLSADALEDRDGLKERIASRLERIEAASGRRISAGTGILATIGGTAPFVGLFGTVWGIMSSFIGISQAQTTNLAVIAPGIAEALLATAMGLVAAIPAVIIYNWFARRIAGYKALVADTATAVLGLVSRDLSRGEAGRHAAAG